MDGEDSARSVGGALEGGGIGRGGGLLECGLTIGQTRGQMLSVVVPASIQLT